MIKIFTEVSAASCWTQRRRPKQLTSEGRTPSVHSPNAQRCQAPPQPVRRMSKQHMEVTKSFVQQTLQRGTATVPFGSGGAHNVVANQQFKQAFIDTCVGRIDEDGFRCDGLGVNYAVKLWNSDEDCKQQIRLTTAKRWLKEDRYTSRVPQVGPFIKILNKAQRRRFYVRASIRLK